VAAVLERGRSPGREPILAAAAVGGAMLVALALGLLHLDSKSFWLDEGVSAQAAAGELGSPGRLISTEPNLALYYGVLHVWQLFGSSEFWLRLPSVFGFVAAVLLTAAVAARVFGRPTAAIAALLISVNAFALDHAQEARPYTFALALSAGTTLLFLDSVEHPTARRWIAWAAVSVFAVFMHPFCGFVLAGQVASLALLPAERIPWRAATAATLGSAAALIPLAVLLSRSPTERIEWIPAPEFEFIRQYAERLVGGDSGQTQLLLYLLFVGIAVAGAVAAARRRGWRTVQTWRVGLVVIWLLAPFVFGLLVSLFQPLLQARYLIVALPPLAILAAAGLVRLRWAPAVAAGVALLVAMHVADIRDGYDDPNEDWRSAAAVIAPRAERSDTVVVHPLGAPALTYYLERTDSPVTDPTYGPPLLESHNPSLDPRHRVWLVFFHRRDPPGDPLPPPEDFVGERRALVGEWSVHEVDLMLYGPEARERA
jgi:mannosyltransferase